MSVTLPDDVADDVKAVLNKVAEGYWRYLNSEWKACALCDFVSTSEAIAEGMDKHADACPTARARKLLGVWP